MSLSGIFHPTRDGARGGRAEFSWGNVAADKYRENYLGHSVMAPVGRWQKGRDLAWYAREAARTGRTAEELEAEELARVRDQEAELLAEALGYKGPKKHLAPPAVSQDELQQAIRREQDGGEGPEGVKGVGFGRLVGWSLP